MGCTGSNIIDKQNKNNKRHILNDNPLPQYDEISHIPQADNEEENSKKEITEEKKNDIIEEKKEEENKSEDVIDRE